MERMAMVPADESFANIQRNDQDLVQYVRDNPSLRRVLNNIFRGSAPQAVSEPDSSTTASGDSNQVQAASGSGDSSGEQQASSSSNDGNAVKGAQASSSTGSGQAGIFGGTSEEDSQSSSQKVWQDCSTLEVRDISASCTPEELLEYWPLDGSFDFLHLSWSPWQSFAARTATLNFTSCSGARLFQDRWHRQTLSMSRSLGPLHVSPAPIQGRDPNLMLVLDRPEHMPLVLLGVRRLDTENVHIVVQLAKKGVFVCEV